MLWVHDRPTFQLGREVEVAASDPKIINNISILQFVSSGVTDRLTKGMLELLEWMNGFTSYL